MCQPARTATVFAPCQTSRILVTCLTATADVFRRGGALTRQRRPARGALGPVGMSGPSLTDSRGSPDPRCQGSWVLGRRGIVSKAFVVPRALFKRGSGIEVTGSQIEPSRSARSRISTTWTSLSKLLERMTHLGLEQAIEVKAGMLRVVASNRRVGWGSIDVVCKRPFIGIADGVKTGGWWVVLDSNQRLPD